MYKFVLIAFCAFVFSLPTWRANAVEQDIVLEATVAKYCTIAGSASPTDDTVTVPILGVGDVDTTPIDRSYAVVCNAAANVTLTSANGAMTTTTASATGFETFINYKVDTSGFVTTSGTTTHSGADQLLDSEDTSGPANTDLDVTITPQHNTDPLAGGDYADRLKIVITPLM